jgi:hypothetical protein
MSPLIGGGVEEQSLSKLLAFLAASALALVTSPATAKT